MAMSYSNMLINGIEGKNILQNVTCLLAREFAGSCTHITDTSAQHQFVICYRPIGQVPLLPGKECKLNELTLCSIIVFFKG